MLDMVYPKGNEKEFKKRAEELGFEGIIFLYPQKNGIKVKADKPVTAGYAERKFFEKRYDYIINSEDSPRKDNFHYKSTSLNHVHAALCRKNLITLAFGFSNLLTSPFERQKILGRMIHNMRLARKYRVKATVFSLAGSPTEMRSPGTLKALEHFLRTKFK